MTRVHLLGPDGQVRHVQQWDTTAVPQLLRWEGATFAFLRRDGDNQQKALFLETPVVEVKL